APSQNSNDQEDITGAETRTSHVSPMPVRSGSITEVRMTSMPETSLKRILVVDVGGTRVKLLVTGQTLKRTMDSGPRLTPQAMVAGVKKLAADWEYDVVSLGVPAPVV